MAAETAAQRAAREFAYKDVDGDANHEDGADRYARTVTARSDERNAREFATVNDSTNVATGLENKTVDLDTVATI